MNSEQDNRYHEKLRNYWNLLKGERPYPTEAEINIDDIAEIWPHCFLISIDDVTRRLGYRYSYLGDSLIEAFGESGSGDAASQLLATGEMPMVKSFNEVSVSRAPITDESEFVNLKNIRIKYRTSLLPLGENAEQISHILGCMRWKEC